MISGIEDRGGGIFKVPSNTSTRVYTVDVDEPSCTCQGFSIKRNRKVSDPLAADPWCTHLDEANAFIRQSGRREAEQQKKEDAAKRKQEEEEQEEAAMAFQKIKMREQLRRELAELQEDL